MNTSDLKPIPTELSNKLFKELTYETEGGRVNPNYGSISVESVHDLVVEFYKKEEETDIAIIRQLAIVIKKLGADHILQSLVNSYRDTIEGEELLNELIEINKK